MDIDFYKTLKTLHIIFFTTWMAGLFLPPENFCLSQSKQNQKRMNTKDL